MANNKRKLNRRDFTYYMQVTDDITKQLIGYLSDISTGGFKLDCDKRIATGQDFRFADSARAPTAEPVKENVKLLPIRRRQLKCN